MSGISAEYLDSIIRKIAAVNHIKDWSYNQVKFQSIAQNYFGILIPVVLSGKRKEKDVKLNLVLKLAPTNEQYRVSGAVTVLFAREVFMYSVVLKKYQELQEHVPKKLQYIIPQSYFVQEEYCKEVIALKDMCKEGYMPYTHEMFLDLNHTLVSLKSLAKLHALSFILKNENPKQYNEIAETCIPLTVHTNKRYMEILTDRLDKALNIFKGTEYIQLIQKLKQNCPKYYCAAVHSVQNTCICHGDIWKENILYKYEGGKPDSACIIDYQTARVCSPAFDTLYFIISSTSTTLRNRYIEQLLDIYYRTFETVLKGFDLKPDELYNRKMFDSDLQVVSPACLITANCALWLSNGLQEVGHVRSKHVWNTKEEKEIALNKYKAIVQEMIEDLSNFGYLSMYMC